MNPVLCRIPNQREVLSLRIVHTIVQLKEYAEARPGKQSMCRFWENVKSGSMFRTRDAIGVQMLPHREVRKLHHSIAIDIDNSNQNGTGRQYKS